MQKSIGFISPIAATAKNIKVFHTVLIAHITFNLPYVILSVLPKLRQLDKYLPEAAMDLGCTPVQAFFKVIIYEIMPGIISGFMLALTLSVDDFVKKSQFTYYTKDALSKVADKISYFAKKEGLTAHAKSAIIRTENKD